MRVMLFFLALWPVLPLLAGELATERVYSRAEEDCLLERLRTAAPDTTVAALQSQCRQAPENRSAAEAMRDTQQREREAERFLIQPHQATYLLPVGIQHGGSAGFDDQSPKEEEAKFQISFKSKLEDDLLGRNIDLYLAYTQTSFWQVYDNDYSNPFRENDYAPELFLEMPLDWRWGEARFTAWRFGALHQSNGRGPGYSRSWNRLYSEFLFEHGDAWLALKPWWRIPEADEDDDNPDITTYLGHGELWAGYRWSDHRLTLMARNYWESDGKGAVQLDYSYPLTRYFRWHVQLFNGYGESLLDYDENVSRLSVGVMLEDGIH